MRLLATALLIAFLASSASAATETQMLADGRAAMQSGNTEQAVKLFEQLVKMKANVAEYHYYLGGAYGRQAAGAGLFGGASLAKKAKGELERAVELNPNLIDARFALIDFYLFAPGFLGGSEEKAIVQASEIKKRDALDGHRAQARVYLHQKKKDLAQKEFVDAVREAPTSAKAHYFLGRFLLSEKNWDGSLHELEMAVKLDPNFMPSYFRIGEHAADSGTNFARGEEAMRKYLTYTPLENEPSHASAWFNLGIIQEKQGRKAEARQSFLNAQKLVPKSKTISEALKRVS